MELGVAHEAKSRSIGALRGRTVRRVRSVCTCRHDSRRGAPSEATQTIRGVTVAVETTTTQASETSYGVSNVLITPKAGYRLASVIGIATNSTDATVSVPDVPARVRDTDGAELQRWGAMRLIISASGGMVPSRLVGHHDVAPQGMEPGGKTYYIVSYQRPSASRGPVTVVWTLGGGRTYTFTLQSP